MVYGNVTIEVTSRCNLHCKMCGRQGRWNLKPKDMSLPRLKKILKEVRDTSPASFVQLVGNGEPFLHPKMREMLKHSVKMGLATSTTTNGSLPLTDLPDLAALVVSIDACTKKLYEMIRGDADYDVLMRNLTDFRLDNPTMKLQFNSVFMRCNMEDLKQMPRLLQKYNVSTWFIQAVKPLSAWAAAQVVPQYLCTAWRYSLTPILNKAKKGWKLAVRNAYHPGMCLQSGQYNNYGVPGCPYIDVEGYVMPCCTIADRTYSFGNVFKDGSLKDIWFGEKAEWWRSQMLSEHPPGICSELCGNRI